jgi:tRNA A-37 threonylcarbamoyl transferase component Bud32
VDRLPHGYTNKTRLIRAGVEKTYEGLDSSTRAAREFFCLTGLQGRYPVPHILEFDAAVPMLVTSEVPGRHGQELIEEGRAAQVLRLIGSQLSDLQSLDPFTVPGLSGPGEVIVHGDFGPQNIMFTIEPIGVGAVLDWELAHVGSAVEDLSWAEWIIRTHHPNAIEFLPELFEGSGLWPSWSDRQAAMVDRCQDYIAFCEESRFDTTTAEWRRRLRSTESWGE